MNRLAPSVVTVLFSMIDVAVTLLGQHPDYWYGNYELAEEGNPLARPFLAWHPLAFVGLAVGWWLTIGIGLGLAPTEWGRRLAAILVAGHGFAAACWCWRWPVFGGVIALAALAMTVLVARWLWKAKTPADRPGFSGAGGI